MLRRRPQRLESVYEFPQPVAQKAPRERRVKMQSATKRSDGRTHTMNRDSFQIHEDMAPVDSTVDDYRPVPFLVEPSSLLMAKWNAYLTNQTTELADSSDSSVCSDDDEIEIYKDYSDVVATTVAVVHVGKPTVIQVSPSTSIRGRHSQSNSLASIDKALSAHSRSLSYLTSSSRSNSFDGNESPSESEPPTPSTPASSLGSQTPTWTENWPHNDTLELIANNKIQIPERSTRRVASRPFLFDDHTQHANKTVYEIKSAKDNVVSTTITEISVQPKTVFDAVMPSPRLVRKDPFWSADCE